MWVTCFHGGFNGNTLIFPALILDHMVSGVRASTLLLASIAVVLVVGGVALAALSQGQAGGKASADAPTITSIPEATDQAAQSNVCCEVSDNSFGIVSYKKIIVPASLLKNLKMHGEANTSTGLVAQHVVINGTLKTAYGDTLVVSTDSGVLRILVPKEWRWGAAEYDLVGLFAEGILAKNMNLRVDAVKIGYKGLPPYILVGYKITLPSGRVLVSNLPING